MYRRLHLFALCDAMNMSIAYKSMLSEVHKLLRLYLTVPVTSTSERTFLAMKRLLTYVRSTMTEKRLNICTLHVHKDLTDQLNVTNIAKDLFQLTVIINDILVHFLLEM